VTAISGRMTMSPLLVQEVSEYLQMPVFTMEDASEGRINHLFVEEPIVAMKLEA